MAPSISLASGTGQAGGVVIAHQRRSGLWCWSPNPALCSCASHERPALPWQAFSCAHEGCVFRGSWNYDTSMRPLSGHREVSRLVGSIRQLSRSKNRPTWGEAGRRNTDECLGAVHAFNGAPLPRAALLSISSTLANLSGHHPSRAVTGGPKHASSATFIRVGYRASARRSLRCTDVHDGCSAMVLPD